MKKPAIPAVPFGTQQYEYLTAVKQNIDMLSGKVGGKISTLGGQATLGDVINKLNEVIDKLQS
jgi:hypothetical protein